MKGKICINEATCSGTGMPVRNCTCPTHTHRRAQPTSMRQVRNQPKAKDQLDWIKLGELLGIEADPETDMVGFVAALKAKIEALGAELNGGGKPAPKPKAPPPDDDMPPTSEEAAANNYRGGGWFTGGGRRPVLNEQPPERTIDITDEEAMTINAMTPKGIDWSEPSPHRRKAKDRREQRRAALRQTSMSASGGTGSSGLHPMLQELVKPTAEDLL